MAVDKAPKHPMVLWAQRSGLVYLTIEVGDMKVEEFKIDGEKFYLKGTDVTGSQSYVVDLEFFDKVKGEEKRQIPTSRHLELVIPKEETKWWPRLLKNSGKVAWIKVDFNKWKDEDEENDEEDTKFDNFDFSSLGLPSGSAGMNNFEDDLGDLSDDEEDMPPLEDADEAKANGTGSAEDKGEQEADVNKSGDAKEPEETKTETAHA